MGCNGLPTTGIQGTIITGTLEVGSKLPHFHADVRISDDITGGTKFTIKTADLDAFTNGPRHVVTNPQAYTNGSRFNDTFNLPYWATTNTNASHLYCYCSKKKEEQRNKNAGRSDAGGHAARLHTRNAFVWLRRLPLAVELDPTSNYL